MGSRRREGDRYHVPRLPALSSLHLRVDDAEEIGWRIDRMRRSRGIGGNYLDGNI
jgi:hypothetical protein